MFVDWEHLIALVQARTDNAALRAANPPPELESGTGEIEPVEMTGTAGADPSPGGLLAPTGGDPFSA